MGNRRRVGAPRLGRSVAAGMAVLLAGGLAVYSTGLAGAAPAPSLAQVKAQVNSLTATLDGINQHYDQVAQQLQAARSRLAQTQRDAAAAQARFEAARATLAQIAAAAYEGSGQTSIAGLLASSDPSVVLKQGSLLEQLAGSRNAQVAQFLADARQLSGVQTDVQRTEGGIAALRTQLAAQKSQVSKLLASKQATLDSLTTTQQAAVTATGPGSSGSTTGTYTGPTTTQAEKAVAFAYAQLGKPYQWGATGPGSYDCSGLVEQAWASAGVAIPRDTFEQWAALPHISASALEPGDLLFYDGIGHVSMYVGHGYIIDAPQTGMNVQLIPMGTSWYSATFIGAARP